MIKHLLLELSTFLENTSSKIVVQHKISFPMIYNTSYFVKDGILRIIYDVIGVSLSTFYSYWVHFQNLVQAKRLLSIKFPFQRYIKRYVLENKIFLQKNADVSSHVTLETCLPWKFSSVVYTDHLCKVSQICTIICLTAPTIMKNIIQSSL